MLREYLIVATIVLSLLITGANAVSPPNSIITYVPISLTNSQSSAFTYNSQVMISVNSLAYKNHEASNLRNIEFFYFNGTLIPSWLEGNATDELNAKSLYTSMNTIYWLRIVPANTFLAADSSNTIYMGFAPASNNLIDTGITGEAPQLSCSGNSVNSMACNGTYAQYDNGGNVFPLYLNFNGVSQPSGWTSVDTGGSFTFDNGLMEFAATGESAAMYETNGLYNPQGNVIDGLFRSTTSGSDQLVGWTDSIPTGNNNSWRGITGNAIGAGAGGGSPAKFELVYVDNGISSNVMYSVNPGTPFVASASWQGSSASATWNYTTSETTNSAVSESSAYPMLYDNNGQTASYQWFRMRLNPPNGVMASAQFNSLVSLLPSPSISIANAITPNSIDVVVNSPSDNALVTATCYSGDTCQIDNSAGNVLASGTTTATLTYNSLPLGYSTLYANDITDGMVSGIASVTRVTVINSIPYTFVNNGDTPFSANTSLSIDFNALANQSIESNSLNNTLIYFKNGTVAYSWIEGNQLNQFSPANQLYEATNVIIWFKSPPSNTFLPAETKGITMATVYLGFSNISNNIIDGNFTGEAPYLSNNYAEYDNGGNVFELYFNGDTPINNFTVGNGFTLTHASGVTINNEVVNALQVQGSCSYPCLSYVYNKGAPNKPTTLQAAVANNHHGSNLASIDIQNSNTAESSTTDLEAVYSGYSGAGFSLAYIQSGSYYANIDSQGSVTTSLDFYTVYYTGSSNSSFKGSISPTLYSGGWSGTVSTNPLASDNTLYIGDGVGNNPSTPTNEYIEFARALVPTPQGESSSSSSYTLPIIAAPSPSSQVVTQGQNATINDSGLSKGKAPYSYQWYASVSSIPTQTAANALEANTLLGIGTTSGKAQSENALFTTNVVTPTGTYYFILYGTDSYGTTLNTTAASVTVVQQPSSSNGPSPERQITISDNINSASDSSAPVITLNSIKYYQNQLPAKIFIGPNTANVIFSCSVIIGSNTFAYQSDVYGLGEGYFCNQTYMTSVANIEVIYAMESSTTTTTTTSITTSASTTTSTVSSTTIPSTTIIPILPIPEFEHLLVNISADSPATINITAYGIQLALMTTSNVITPVNVTISNVTRYSSTPRNYSKIAVFELNESPSENISVNVAFSFECSAGHTPVPFMLVNGTWQQVYNAVALQNPCRITLLAPSGHQVGIFQPASSSSNVPTENVSETTTNYYLTYATVAIISILILFTYTRRRKRKASQS